MVILLRPALKVIAAVNVVVMFFLSGTSLYASNSQVVAPSLHLQKLNHKQSVEMAHPDQGEWLLLASNGISDDDEDCEERDRHGKCRPIKKLEVHRIYDLEFGKVVAQMERGRVEVVIDPFTGNKNVIGGVNLGGNYGRAKFEVQGEPGKGFFITLPGRALIKGTSNAMIEVDTFEVNPGLTGKIGPDGKAYFYIGATAKMKSKADGEASVPIEVYVDYQ